MDGNGVLRSHCAGAMGGLFWASMGAERSLDGFWLPLWNMTDSRQRYGAVSPTEIRRSQTLPALVLGFGLSVMGFRCLSLERALWAGVPAV